MKRLSIAATTAVFCMSATSAQAQQAPPAAMHLDPGGQGQVLLFPLYSANQDNVSVINISTELPQAVRVSFREGDDSRIVFQFNLYLAANDTWSGAVFATDADGPARILADDSSCTVPNLRAANLPLAPSGRPYMSFDSGAYTGANDDGGNPSPLRTRAGFVEVIAMGSLHNTFLNNPVANAIAPSPGSTSNPNQAEPADCASIERRWASGGAWNTTTGGDRTLDVSNPWLLTGRETIINVQGGTQFSVSPTAIGEFYSYDRAPRGGLHFPPDSAHPDLTDASNGSDTVRTITIAGYAGDVVTSTWPAHSADAVSALLMKSDLRGEFDVRPGLRGRTEWVLAFPTQSFYSGRDIAVTRSPFTADRVNGRSCEFVPIHGQTFDARDSTSTDGVPDRCGDFPSCGLHSGVCIDVPTQCVAAQRLCGSVATVSFDQPAVASGGATTIFGARGALDRTFRLASAFDRGKARVNLEAQQSSVGPRHRLMSLDNDEYVGMPVIGFEAQVISNDNARPHQRADYPTSAALIGRTRSHESQ